LGVVVTCKTVAQKAHIKPGARIAVLNPVDGVVESLGLPSGVSFTEPASAQLLFLFVRTHAELQERMPAAVSGLAPEGALWVFFRKGSKSAGLDMNRNDVWAVAEPEGLRPLGLVCVNEEWSAFRFKQGQSRPGGT
jgi:hypothetical protein